MKKRTRRTFSQEYKSEAVKMLKEGKLSVTKLGKQIGVPASSLCRWQATEELAVGQQKGSVESDVMGELSAMKKELVQVKMERDFLKKTAAFFARDH
jgi:transposase